MRPLLAAHLAHSFASSPAQSVHAFDVAALAGPDVSFWTARIDGVVAGCGALRQIDAVHGEVKSMHTDAAARGRGIARAMLDHIIAESRRRGYHRLSLETGSRDAYLPARRLYAGAGFTPCGPFADYTEDPESAFMTLELEPDREGEP
ncbi:MAG: GNAT family N-acetyltransferase [Pseudomonadota bacterium]|nr:GNAT family N-acetyltransferase [Pseudomonadota bacterium]